MGGTLIVVVAIVGFVEEIAGFEEGIAGFEESPVAVMCQEVHFAGFGFIAQFVALYRLEYCQ